MSESETTLDCEHTNIVIDTARKESYCKDCGKKFNYLEVEHVEQ